MMAMRLTPERPEQPTNTAPRRFDMQRFGVVDCRRAATNETRPDALAVGVRTIIDARHAVYGREVVFADVGAADDHALQLPRRLRELSWATACPAQKTLVRASPALISNPAIDWLPAGAHILALDLAGAPDEALLARCRTLREHGFSLALTRYAGIDERSRPLLSLVDIVEINLDDCDQASCRELAGSLAHLPVKLLATGVNTAEQMRLCRQAGFHLFQGDHVAPLETLGTRWLPVARSGLVRLLALLVGRADAPAIEEACRKEPSLIYNLLHLARLSAHARRPQQRVFSLPQALALIDENSLRLWLEMQLTMLDSSRADDEHTGRCMQMAALGGRLLELFAQRLTPNDAELPAAAYLAGSLSLMSGALGLPLTDFVQYLPVRPEVLRALLRGEGSLGQCLEVLGHFDKRDALACDRQIRRLSHGALGYADLQACFAEALAWLTASEE